MLFLETVVLTTIIEERSYRPGKALVDETGGVWYTSKQHRTMSPELVREVLFLRRRFTPVQVVLPKVLPVLSRYFTCWSYHSVW